MIKWAPYLFVRIIVCFCAGILCQIYGGSNFQPLPLLIALFSVIFLVFHVAGTLRASLIFISLAGFAGLIVIFLLGVTITYQRTASNSADHLLHQKQPIKYYTGVISDFVVGIHL